MKKLNHKKKFLALMSSFVLILGISVGITMAYFTAYSTEAGVQELVLGIETTVNETVKDLDKSVTLTNQGEAPAYVRVRAYYPEMEEVTVQITAGTGWNTGADGWYYYEKPLLGGETTPSSIDVAVSVAEEFKQEFNIIVVHEAVPVLYTQDGEPYADWNITIAASGEEE